MNLIQLKTEVKKILNGFEHEDFLLKTSLWSDSEKAPLIELFVYKNGSEHFTVKNTTHQALLTELRGIVGNNFKDAVNHNHAGAVESNLEILPVKRFVPAGDLYQDQTEMMSMYGHERGQFEM